MKNKEINYRKEAFLHPWNLAFLAAILGTTLALGQLLPAAFDLALVLGAAAELLILGILPNNRRFRNIVKARWTKEMAKPPSSREIYAELSRENQRRYVKLRDRQKKIEANYRKFSYVSQGLLNGHKKKIDGLLTSCLKMMLQQERYTLYSTRVQEREVLDDMTQLREEMQVASEYVRRVKLRRFKVLEQRLARFKKSQEHLEILNAQIETIEDVIDYIHEQSITLQNPEQISVQLDVLLADVEEAESSLSQIESVFGNQALSGLGKFDPLDLEDEPQRSSARQQVH